MPNTAAHYIIWPQRRWVDDETLIGLARDSLASSKEHRGAQPDEGYSAAVLAAIPNADAARDYLNDSGDVTFGPEPGAPVDPGPYSEDEGDYADWREDNDAYCEYAAS